MKRKKSFFNFFLAVIFCLMTFTILYPSTENQTMAANWYDYANDQSFTSTGNGTQSSPYKISTAEQLATVARYITNFRSKHFELTTDLNLSKYNWYPIGTESNPFAGTFDGKGFNISGIIISKSDNRTYAGLFGYASGGTLKNIKITSIPASSKIVGHSSSSAYVGAVVGYLAGTIQNCLTEKVVVNAVSSSNAYAGGIVGRAHYTSVVSECFNFSNVLSLSTSLYAYAGGIIGYSDCQIKNSINKGEIRALTGSSNSYTYAGGIAGNTQATISTSYNIGKIFSGSSNQSSITIDGSSFNYVANSTSYAGGIAGFGTNITNCFNTGDINSKSSTIKSVVSYSPEKQSTTETVLNKSGVGGFSQVATLQTFNYDFTLDLKPDGKDPPDYSKDESVGINAQTTLAYAGGIVGYSSGTIQNVYNTGAVSGGERKYIQTNAYSTYYKDVTRVQGRIFEEEEIFVHYATVEYVETVYYSAINGNRQNSVSNGYGLNSYYINTRKISINTYEEGLKKKTGSANSTSSTGDLFQKTPNEDGYYYGVKNSIFNLYQNNTVIKLSFTYEIYRSISDPNLTKSYEFFNKNLNQNVAYTVTDKAGITASKLGNSVWETDDKKFGGMPVLKGLYW